jgi:hypothetical protein
MRRNPLIILLILMCAPPAIAEAPPPEATTPPANPACDLEAMRCGADILLKNSTSPMPPAVVPATIAPSPEKVAEVPAKPERPKSTFWQDLFWFIVGRSVR